jgi:hypothetical protein
MPSAAFSHDVRALLCEQCGAPMTAPPQGGTATCGYCGAVHEVAARVDRALLAPQYRPPISEDARLKLLRQQAGRPMTPPSGLEAVLHGGEISRHRIDEALLVWQATRREIKIAGSPDAAERLLYLTLALQNAVARDPDRQRALLESALDALTLPRHRQLVLAALSRLAVRAGDLRAAREWLAACDPRAEDLHADSAYRLAAAFHATARREHRQVLAVLGEAGTDVPFSMAMATLALLVRANAHERLGDVERATSQLGAALGDARVRHALSAIVEMNAELELCRASLPAALAAHDERAARELGRPLGGLGCMAPLGALMLIGVAIAVAAWAAGALPLEALPGIGAGLGISGVVFSIIGVFAIAAGRRAARLRRHGRVASAEVVAVEPTGSKVNGVPFVRLTLRLDGPDGEPYEARTSALLSTLVGVEAGSVVPVRVDPDDPTRLIVETI